MGAVQRGRPLDESLRPGAETRPGKTAARDSKRATEDNPWSPGDLAHGCGPRPAAALCQVASVLDGPRARTIEPGPSGDLTNPGAYDIFILHPFFLLFVRWQAGPPVARPGASILREA